MIAPATSDAFGLVSTAQPATGLQFLRRAFAAAGLLVLASGAVAQQLTYARGVLVPAGDSVIITGPMGAGPGYSWQFNGIALQPTGYSLRIDNLQPGHAGLYTPIPLGGGPAAEPTILGIGTHLKAIGYGQEVAANVVHPNGRVYDQILLDGAATTVTADPGQTVRVSFLDLNDDIVQVEFSGSGTLSIWLDQASGPAAPVNYNQNVAYMKGHASIVVAGADQTSHLAVFSVGPITAVNQSLFKPGQAYDGVADVAFIAIHSRNGNFGAVRAANTSFFANRGYTGIYAPGIFFTRPVYVHDISAYAAATPVFMLGAGSDVRVTGGDLAQPNGRAVKVSGINQLKYMNGTDSHGVLLPARANQARLEENGVDVTSRIVAEVFIQE